MSTIQQHLEKARQVRAEHVAAQRYSITWRGGDNTVVVGVEAAAAVVKLRVPTLRCYLATGKGKCTRKATNPITLEDDIVTIERLPSAAKAKRPRGRPRKHFTNDPRLGIEFAPPAKTVPKTRNRRTDEKSDQA